jgi:thiamine-monophosphate kinase
LSTPAEKRTPTFEALGERGVIDLIRRRFPSPAAILPVGIGDDAAVAVSERGALEVLTTDSLVEGVHFDRRFSSFRDVGYKALAVNVSDVAAMGGTPRLALLSFIVPAVGSREFEVRDLDELLDGFAEIAAETRVALAGGNISRTAGPAPFVVDVSLVGWVRPRKVLTRAGGHAGDALYVTGTVGTAAAGLGWLRAHAANPSTAPDDAGLAECVSRYRRPSPRARIGAVMGRTRAASAAMDLSDGLADAVTQVAEASGTGAVIDAEALPLHPAAVRWFEREGREPIQAAVAGGDDYELLFAVPRRAKGRLRHAAGHARGVPLTRIGELTKDRSIVLRRDGASEPLPRGFTHF